MVEIKKSILDKFVTGDFESFNIIYYAYYKLIKQIAFSYTSDNSVSDNLVQETFLLLWENRDKVDSNNKNFKYYLTTIANNTCINYLTKENKSKIIYKDDLETNKLYQEYDTINQNYYMFRIKQILDKQSYDVIVLHYINNLKYKEIAKIKNKSVSTITSVASRAMRLLKEKLRNE
ncbi:MAG: sigma-70 family RNA polymerase sigma factor [Acholeplasmatales bacterium]|jgi:RNA polymerase sigma-70 factor (ECF subfamily)|nr:sigma-70 family RNA polymerase sigma factor [Acholeplasmatales bacterium]